MSAYMVSIPKGMNEFSDEKQMLARSPLYAAERIAITPNTGAAASLRNCLRFMAKKSRVASIEDDWSRELNNGFFLLFTLFSKIRPLCLLQNYENFIHLIYSARWS